ncbi:hypothetical protein JCM19992_24940 [Thermostilla marina]
MSVRPIAYRSGVGALPSKSGVQRRNKADSTNRPASDRANSAQTDVPDPSRAGFIPTPASVPCKIDKFGESLDFQVVDPRVPCRDAAPPGAVFAASEDAYRTIKS